MTGVQSRHPKSCAEGSWRRGGAAAIACLALGVVFCARPAAAETLVEALSNAYLINPVLNAERANLRATDEQVAVAKSGLRPNISASGDAAFQNQESDIVGGNRVAACRSAMRRPRQSNRPSAAFSASQTNVGNIESQLSSDGVTHPRGYSVQLSQPIFEGFQNINAIRQAKATVQAGREGLRATEQTTLLNAATAYVDVVRDQAVVQLAPDQRRRADRAAAADQGSLQCRRGDPHRRGPGRSAPVRLPSPSSMPPRPTSRRAAPPTSRSSAIRRRTSCIRRPSCICCRASSRTP